MEIVEEQSSTLCDLSPNTEPRGIQQTQKICDVPYCSFTIKERDIFRKGPMTVNISKFRSVHR